MISITTLKSALVSTLLMAILAVLLYVVQVGNVFELDLKTITNIAILSLATGLISLIKNALTSDSGVFAGSVKIQ